ncbi:Zinc finger, C6HC-type [Artemisia annua]|uniref:RBR-type E3 ubiquitin transferase n=1 Tax=Artemisia annua TaxID=35608 RepID=A0A2U1KPF2_ARTAN|nr:Zinc finger, C6HC-type [Artemisia annua]
MASDNDSEKSYVILKEEDGLLNFNSDSEKSYIILKEDDLLNSGSGSENSYDVLKEDNLQMNSDNDSEKSYDVLKEDNLQMNSDSDSDSDIDVPYTYNVFNAKSYVILKEDHLIKRQQHIIHEITSLLTISTNDACMLLLKYNWRVTDVYEAWFKDERKVCDDIGLLDVDRDVKFPKHDERKVKCGICFDSVRFDETANCGCNHNICKVCWRSYVSTAINEGPGCLTLKCPVPSCGVAVSPDMVDMLAKGKDKIMYNRFWLRSYVKNSKKIKWCPGLGCDYAVEFDDDFTTDCYNCMEEAHSPLDCQTVGKWLMKNMAEAENTSWILANTKPCPNCKIWIERYGGCPSMTCICGYEFCWLCLEPSRGHNNLLAACGREGGKVNEDERQCELAKKSADTYTHYYERWAANEKYRKQALVDLHNVETVHLEKISSAHYLPRAELMFFIDAWSQIVECRRVLKWAYAYGYYIPKEEEPKTVFFEYVLGEAEDSLKRLHLCVEKELQTCIEYGYGFKQINSSIANVTGLTIVTRTYFQNLVRALENRLSEVASHEDESFNCLNLLV